MHSRSSIGMGLAASLVVGWSVNHLAGTSAPAAGPTYSEASTKGKTKPASGGGVKQSSSGKRESMKLPEACTAYLDPVAGHDGADENWGAAKAVIDRFLNRPSAAVLPGALQYVIAPVPDPRHTRLTMLFDRSIDAITDGASDSGFRYDSS